MYVLIVAARWLKEQGHQVLIFEKAKEIGGVWKYQEEINIDASLYRSLRTNLPTSK
jgi:cation diffusion facilitator CzcD-associated flavoprotein CzcO